MALKFGPGGLLLMPITFDDDCCCDHCANCTDFSTPNVITAVPAGLIDGGSPAGCDFSVPNGLTYDVTLFDEGVNCDWRNWSPGPGEVYAAGCTGAPGCTPAATIRLTVILIDTAITCTQVMSYTDGCVGSSVVSHLTLTFQKVLVAGDKLCKGAHTLAYVSKNVHVAGTVNHDATSPIVVTI